MRNLGLEAHRATAELSDLVSRGVAVRIGERRHARYLLAPARTVDSATAQQPVVTQGTTAEELVWAALADGAELSRRDLEERTGLTWMKALRALARLEKRNQVIFTAPARSPLRRYRRS
jgi:ATP-dependent DNA helicase RecG